MDVNITFLNGVNEEEVYIEQPQVFEVHEMDSHASMHLELGIQGLTIIW